MKKNSFYIAASTIAILDALIFWLAAELRNPLGNTLLIISVIAGAIIICLLRTKIDDSLITDELISKINSSAATKTLLIYWVVFFAFMLSTLNMALGIGDKHFSGMIMHSALLQLVFLASILIIYTAFRVYYTKKYGGYETDEESD